MQIKTNRGYVLLKDEKGFYLQDPFTAYMEDKKYYIDEIEIDKENDVQVRLISELKQAAEMHFTGKYILIDDDFRVWVRYGDVPIPKVKK